MDGAQISVGRLGVIVEVDLRIVPQRMLTRIVTDETFDELVAGVEAAASAYSAAVAANASAAEALRALEPLDMTQARPAALPGSPQCASLSTAYMFRWVRCMPQRHLGCCDNNNNDKVRAHLTATTWVQF